MRKQLSIVLILVSSTLLILPGTGGYSFKADPEELLQQTMNPDIFVSVDRVATILKPGCITLMPFTCSIPTMI